MVGRLQARNPKSSFSSGRTRAYDRTQDSLLFQNEDGIYAAHSKNVEDDRISCRANSIARFPVVLLAEISRISCVAMATRSFKHSGLWNASLKTAY